MDFYACSERSLLPGNEEAFKSAGRSYKAFAEELRPLASRLRVLAETGLSGTWEGPAGLVFLMYLEILPSNMTAYADAHDEAGDALLGVGNELIGRRLIMGRVLTEGRQAQDHLRALQRELRSLMAATNPNPRRAARLEREIRSVQELLRRKEQEVADERSTHRELCKRSARRIEGASEIIHRQRDWTERVYQAWLNPHPWHDSVLNLLGLAHDFDRVLMWQGSKLIAHFARNDTWRGRWGGHKRWALAEFRALFGPLTVKSLKVPWVSALLGGTDFIIEGREHGFGSTEAAVAGVDAALGTLASIVPFGGLAYAGGKWIGEQIWEHTPIGDILQDSFQSDLNGEIDYWMHEHEMAIESRDIERAIKISERLSVLTDELMKESSGWKGALNAFNPFSYF